MENIVLIGFMATGKSSVAKLLSKKLNMEIIDTDIYIEQKENMSISEIFNKKGEEYFRDLEKQSLEILSNKKNIILSTGGGIISNDQNIELLRKIGKVVWLKARTDTIIRNLKKSKIKRPLLMVENKEQKIESLLKSRLDKYSRCSHFEIDIDDKNIDEVVSNILLSLPKI
ncbi:shikimate kinase [Tepidibacter aestuarii]|uniref:shikimate kinase n=1 Tax=Tepidibacter aestuarii TaxID=2925782 RepID=UPI0020C1132B|nr:shikimate kinase [Tepidibacter aestuarii]CAH2212947.1 Shikimate kinase [Tepidibacter aestuarii]